MTEVRPNERSATSVAKILIPMPSEKLTLFLTATQNTPKQTELGRTISYEDNGAEVTLTDWDSLNNKGWKVSDHKIVICFPPYGEPFRNESGAGYWREDTIIALAEHFPSQSVFIFLIPSSRFQIQNPNGYDLEQCGVSLEEWRKDETYSYDRLKNRVTSLVKKVTSTNIAWETKSGEQQVQFINDGPSIIPEYVLKQNFRYRLTYRAANSDVRFTNLAILPNYLDAPFVAKISRGHGQAILLPLDKNVVEYGDLSTLVNIGRQLLESSNNDAGRDNNDSSNYFPVELLELRDILADLYPEKIQWKRVLDETGISTVELEWSDVPLDRWHSTVGNISRSGKVIDIVNYLMKEYPSNLRISMLAAKIHGKTFSAESSSQPRSPLPNLVHELQDVHEKLSQLLNKELNRSVSSPALKAEQLFLTAPPQPMGEILSRDGLISNVLANLQSAAWCFVVGETGVGKTTLSRFVIKDLDKECFWARFRHVPTEAAGVYLQRVVEVASKIDKLALHNWIEVCSQALSGKLLVLDDLPRIKHGDSLAEYLTAIAKSFARNNAKLITTSSLPPPSELKTILGSNLAVSKVEGFTDEEIVEYLQLCGAPSALLETKIINLISTSTKRHPILVTDLVRYLKSQSWNFTTNQVVDILAGRYAASTLQDWQAILVETVPNPETREMIYRLSLKTGPFSDSDLQAISVVPPLISRASEHLTSVLGIWIQPDSKNRFVVSPLIEKLGQINLATEVKRQANLALARSVLTKGVISLEEGFSAIVHSSAGGDMNMAGTILLQTLTDLDGRADLLDAYGFLHLWTEQPLPSEMNRQLKLLIRAKQIRAFGALERDHAFLMKDFDEIIKHSDDQDSYAVIGSLMFLLNLPTKLTTSQLNDYLKIAVETLPVAGKLSVPRIDIPVDLFAWIVWSVGWRCRTFDEIKGWLSLVQKLSGTEFLQAILASDIAPHASSDIGSKALWLVEARKPEEQRNWANILSQLLELSEIAEGINLDLLFAWLIRSRVVVLGEYQKDLVAALSLGKNLYESNKSPTIKFLAADSVALQLLYAKKYEDALKWFEISLSHPCPQYPLDVSTALLSAAQCCRDNADKAVAFIVKALEVLNSHEEIPVIESVKALGEYGISLWRIGDLTSAFTALSKAADRLLGLPENDYWKFIYSVLNYILGYLIPLSKSGAPPEKDADGNVYTPPEQGLFLAVGLPDVYNNRLKKWAIPFQLKVFAESLDLIDEAKKWSYRAYELSGSSNVTVGMFTLYFLIADSNFSEALKVARGMAILMEAFVVDPGLRNSSYQKDVSEIVEKIPSANRMNIERNALLVGFIPSLIWICSETNMEKRKDLMEQLSRTCNSMAEDAFSSEIWIEAAEVAERFFSEANFVNSVNRGNEFARQGKSELHLSTYLSVSFSGRPKDALTTQLIIFEHLFNPIKYPAEVYSKIIFPFILGYWKETFQENRFYFSAPVIVEQELQRLEKLDKDSMISLFKTLCWSLGVKAGSAVNSWLGLIENSNGNSLT